MTGGVAPSAAAGLAPPPPSDPVRQGQRHPHPVQHHGRGRRPAAHGGLQHRLHVGPHVRHASHGPGGAGLLPREYPFQVLSMQGTHSPRTCTCASFPESRQSRRSWSTQPPKGSGRLAGSRGDRSLRSPGAAALGHTLQLPASCYLSGMSPAPPSLSLGVQSCYVTHT